MPVAGSLDSDSADGDLLSALEIFEVADFNGASGCSSSVISCDNDGRFVLVIFAGDDTVISAAELLLREIAEATVAAAGAGELAILVDRLKGDPGALPPSSEASNDLRLDILEDN